VAISKADVIRQLSKKWLENRDDVTLNELTHAIHDGVHFHVHNRGILERYQQSSLEIHFHFFRLFNEGSMNSDACATAYFRRRLDSGKLAPGRLVDNCKVSIGSVNGGKRKHPVLINIHELVNDPQGMVVGVRIPTVIRLQSLNDCLRIKRYPAESVSHELSLESFESEADGKLIGSGRLPVVSENQLIDDVVKGGTKVVQTFPDEDAKAQVGSGKVVSEEKDPTAYVRVSLGNNAAFIETRFDESLYRLKVLFSPDEFLSNTIERMIHDREENSKDENRPEDTDS
jgi:hypothetical protein